ncbi:septum site-determining protein Ssd [Corynebacterium gerontici]|nr:septum site-determining protein Ssd [Corynebacterium gerontici]
MKQQAVLIAITDPTLHSEASHVAAASGREVISTADPREITRIAPKAAAVLVDATTAHHVAKLPTHRAVLLSAEPGPVDWQLAMEIHAEAAMLLPAQAPELLELIGREDEPPPGEHTAIMVCGAAGGAGSTTLAAGLAHEIAGAVLIDADPYSGGCDLALGIEDQPGLRWNDLGGDVAGVSGEELARALPHSLNGVPVLTAARGGERCLHAEKLQAATRALLGSMDVVIDARLGSELAHAALEVVDVAVVVIPAEVRAAAAAAELQRQLQQRHVLSVGVLRHRTWSGLDCEEAENISGVRIVAELPNMSRLSKMMELEGLIAVPKTLRRTAMNLLQAIEAA